MNNQQAGTRIQVNVLQDRLDWTPQRMAEFLNLNLGDYAARLNADNWQPEEAKRLQHLEHAFTEANRVFRDENEAGRWLAAQIISLDHKMPIDYLGHTDGLNRILETLTKIEYGMY